MNRSLVHPTDDWEEGDLIYDTNNGQTGVVSDKFYDSIHIKWNNGSLGVFIPGLHDSLLDRGIIRKIEESKPITEGDEMEHLEPELLNLAAELKAAGHIKEAEQLSNLMKKALDLGKAVSPLKPVWKGLGKAVSPLKPVWEGVKPLVEKVTEEAFKIKQPMSRLEQWHQERGTKGRQKERLQERLKGLQKEKKELVVPKAPVAIAKQAASKVRKQSQVTPAAPAAPAAGTQTAPEEEAQQALLTQKQEQKKMQDQQTTQKGIQSAEIGRQLEEARKQGTELSKEYQEQKNDLGDNLQDLRKQRQSIMSAGTELFEQITKLADDLDASDLYKEASELDNLLRRGL